MWRLKTISGTVALAMMLQACAAEPARESRSLEEMLADQGYRMGDEIPRIRQFSYNGWNEVDDLHLILRSRASDHYLVTLGSICDGLRFSPQIVLSTTMGEFTKFDYIVVGQTAGVNRRCNVKTLHELHKIEPVTEDD